MKKVAVVGVGGVGGYLAGMLGRKKEKDIVLTVVARGARAAAIREKGLLLHSDYHGEIVTHPDQLVESASDLGVQDVIFICVKNYSLEEVCEALPGAVGENTVIVPVMNGVDPGDRVRSMVKKGQVVDALIYIVAFANADYSVTQQGGFASLRIGRMDRADKEDSAVKAVAGVLEGGGIDYKISRDIEADIWKKYILNCAYNVSTACYDNTIGQLRADERKAKEYEALVYEAFAVAVKKGVHVENKHADAIIRRFYEELADDATSSLQRDVVAGRPTELETFSGYLVREAKRLGVDAPVSTRMYERLKAQVSGR